MAAGYDATLEAVGLASTDTKPKASESTRSTASKNDRRGDSNDQTSSSRKRTPAATVPMAVLTAGDDHNDTPWGNKKVSALHDWASTEAKG